MIRGVAQRDDGTRIVLFGLTAENLDRLREGQPIVVNLRRLNPDGDELDFLPDLDVAVYFHGATEAGILASMSWPPQQ